jgi:lysozyme family protein
MKENFHRALQCVLVHEGGFANHPKDPGGATMKGITLKTFRRFFGPGKTVQDLKNVGPEQLAFIYRTGYWDKCSCDQLPAGIDYAVFDFAVNSGPGRAARMLQSAVGAEQDGIVGPATLSLVTAREPAAIIRHICDHRLSFLQGLDTFVTFGKGWGRRVASVRQRALEMAGAAAGGSESEHEARMAEIVVNIDYDIVERGAEGPWVRKLQEALQIEADGKFGPKTEAALKDFQAANGLDPDGIAGRMTYRALGLID